MARRSAASLAELYARCVQMANENKISAKNAFDLPLIEHMDAIVESFLAGGSKQRAGGATPEAASAVGSSGSSHGRVPADSRAAANIGGKGGFHEVSCTIEASARIYACRVDCVHIDTYRVLGGLGGRVARLAEQGEEEEEEEEEEEGGEAGIEPAGKRRRVCGASTLERNEANITQRLIEVEERDDPTFLNMAAAFDAGGARGMLLATLPVAEDLSLVFNGDVPLSRAAEVAEAIFERAAEEVPVESLGFGDDPSAALAELATARLCPPELGGLRRQLWGDLDGSVALPADLEALLAPESHRPAPSPAAAARDPRPPADGGGPPPLPLADAAPELELDAAAAADEPGGQPLLPIAGAEAPEDIVPFEELFETFCAGGGPHQFAYFDKCWAKLPLERWARHAKEGSQVAGVLLDAESPKKECQEEKPKTKKPSKRSSIFDLDDLDAPIEPLEMEPAHKHQLTEEAEDGQLHVDVPPYMIDHITMPNWQPSMYDVARLGLRPHLLLKFRRKEPPEVEGPHSFFDLFSTDLAENPEAPPWLLGADNAGERAVSDFGAPPDLGADFDAESQDPPPMPGLDFDLAEPSQTVRSTELPSSKSAEFVNVKAVKRHLWACISEDNAQAKALPEPRRAASSFQGLMDRAVERLPQAATESLSTAVCFICTLHLCNEKGLELETDDSRPLGDFNVVSPP